MAGERLILASASAWRLDLLRQAGIEAEARAPAVDEEMIGPASPEARAVARALAKARAVARLEPGALVLGADQVAHVGSECFGKPRDAGAHAARLRSLRGKAHHLTTGVALVERGEEETFAVTSEVRMRADVSDEEIARYVALGEAAGCAAGYMVERRGAWLVESVAGDWTNVIGMPVLALVGCLRARGWRFDG